MNNHEVFGQGKVPSSWKIKKISDIGDVTTGTTPSTSISEYYGGEFLFVKPSDLDDSIYIYDTETKLTKIGFEQTRRLPKKTVLVTCIGSIGKMGIAEKDLATNQQINSIVPSEEIISEYLFYNLKVRESFLDSYANKSILPIINKTDFEKIHVPIPPLVEQRGIVEVLGTADECIRLTDAVIERAEELKRGLMQQLLTRGIGHTEYKETSLGEIPKTWKIIPVKDVLLYHNAGIYKKKALYGTGHNIVGVADLYYHDSIDGQIFRNVQLTKEEYEEYSVKEGDLIYGESSLVYEGIGKTLVVTKNGDGTAFAWHTRRFRVDRNEIDPYYLHYALNLEVVRRSIMKRATRTAITGITVDEFFNTRVPLPSLSEQKQITRIISNVEELVRSEHMKKKHINLVKQGLMQELLSGKIRVGLKGDELHRIGDGREANN